MTRGSGGQQTKDISKTQSFRLANHLVEQTCSTDYYTVFRCAEEGQISCFDPLPRKIRCRSARKKSKKLKMSTSRRRYVQIPGNSVSVSLRASCFHGLRGSQDRFLRPKIERFFWRDFSGEEFREKHYCPCNFVWSGFIFPESEHL